MKSLYLLAAALNTSAYAWVSSSKSSSMASTRASTQLLMSSSSVDVGGLHGQNSCFLPLEQCDEEYYAPRIVQIAGAYPGITKEELNAVTSTPPSELGQWAYDFSDPDGPQLGTVAIPGCNIVATCEDPAVIIGEHFALGVPLPDSLTEPVDLLILVDRAKKGFAERKFHVVNVPGEGVVIRGFETRAEIPEGSEILGRVDFCLVPWLPCMQKKKSGFAEDEQLY